MKKTCIYFIGMLIALSTFCACSSNNEPVLMSPVVYHAYAKGVVVNEHGYPIPNIRYTDGNMCKADYDYFHCTDENGVFECSFHRSNYVNYNPKDSLFNVVFYDIDGEENGSYEPLVISDPIYVELIWNGKEFDLLKKGEEWVYYGSDPIVFEPIDLGTFVMHEKK